MTIQQVCKQRGLTADTVRYYERIGLIEVEKGAYFKQYSRQTLETLVAIKKLRLAGLTLSEIKRLLSFEVEPTELNREQIDSVSAVIDNAIERADVRARELAETQRLLATMKRKLIEARNENR